MRRELARQEGLRKKFTATFDRLGKKVGYQGYAEETILLKNIADENGERMTEHLWFSYTKGFQKLKLSSGDHIEFEARIKEYQKGYVNRTLKMNNKTSDYKLSHPTKIKLVKKI